MANTYKQNKLDLQVCWNCRNYCSFSGICLYHGIDKSILDECDKFDVDGYKEKVEGLENEITELNRQIKILQNKNEKLELLESMGVDDYITWDDDNQIWKIRE